jgi:hypothetical protein
MLSFEGGDDFIWIGGPGERSVIFFGFCNEAIDGGPEIDGGMEGAPDVAAFALKYNYSLKYRHFLVVLPVKRQQAARS